MARANPVWRRRRQRLFVPPEACGLLDAVAEACRGRDNALLRWERTARPALAHALACAGIDVAAAEEAIMHLQEQAFDAVRSGRQIGFEPAWMRSILGNAWVAGWRRLERDRARTRDIAAHAAAVERRDDVDVGELREEFDVAMRALPRRFALAIRLRLSGLSLHEVRNSLAVEFGVGVEMARKIDTQALELIGTAFRRQWATSA